MSMRLTRRRSLGIGAMAMTGTLLAAVRAANAGRGVSGAIPNLETITPLPLAIPDFVATTTRLERTALDLVQSIRPLLKASGPFPLVDTDDVNTRRVALDAVPRPADWQSPAIAVLVVGEVSEVAEARMRVAFRLWNVPMGLQIMGQSHTAPIAEWPRVARMIAGEIFERTSEG
jgi:TolB protein